MALLKSIPAKWGLSAEYWSLTDVNINWDSKSAHLVLSGYIDEDSKKVKGELPLDSRSFDFNDELPFTKGGNSEEEGYEYIKSYTTTDSEGNVIPGEFNDAIDC